MSRSAAQCEYQKPRSKRMPRTYGPAMIPNVNSAILHQTRMGRRHTGAPVRRIALGTAHSMQITAAKRGRRTRSFRGGDCLTFSLSVFGSRTQYGF
ncbi:hypothetical protein BV20DRAFT_817015 [Pilatotrama ljubarskyi]|nr:hypothetical protein BV20DRAFT_817015 [Pilatotrama ljubarskyi]